MKRVFKQTAVYWASPSPDDWGKNAFDTGVEIGCMWRDEIKLIVDNEGKEVVSKAAVHVLQDLDEQGMLFLGELTDLTAAQKLDPTKVSRAYEIKKFLKIPSMHLKDEYNRKAML